jgi:outer membrane protein TolC
MQMFPWFGMLRNQKDEASQMANARYQVFLEAKNQIFYQVKDTWLEMHRLDAEIKLMEETVEILRSFERLALSRFRSGSTGSPSGTQSGRNMNRSENPRPNQDMSGEMGGMGNQQTPSGGTRPQSSGGMNTMPDNTMGSGGGMVDVLRAQMEIKEMESRIATLHDSRRPLVTRFNRLLNRSAGENVLLADTLTPQALPMERLALLDSVMHNNPMVRMYDWEMLAYEAQKEMARREGYPMIGAGFNYMIFSPRTGNDQMAMGGQNMLMPMVSVTIPINRKRYRAMEKEAELLREAAQYEQTGVRNLLSVQWDEAIRDLDNAERRIRLYREQETLAGQTMRLITTAYSAEGAGFEEVLRVQQQLIDYRLNVIQAVVDQNKTIARIEMLAAININ